MKGRVRPHQKELGGSIPKMGLLACRDTRPRKSCPREILSSARGCLEQGGELALGQIGPIPRGEPGNKGLYCVCVSSNIQESCIGEITRASRTERRDGIVFKPAQAKLGVWIGSLDAVDDPRGLRFEYWQIIGKTARQVDEEKEIDLSHRELRDSGLQIRTGADVLRRIAELRTARVAQQCPHLKR